MRVLSIVFSNEDYERTVASLRNQTVPNDEIIASKTYPDKEHHVRVMRAVNDVLATVNLDNYDYILITAGDVVFPRDFLERCIKTNADVFGPGDALLFKRDAFKKLGDKFPNIPTTDTYITFLAMEKGLKVKSANRMIHRLRRVGELRSPIAYLEYGKQAYRLGYEPIHMLFTSLNASVEFRNPKFLIEPFGYANALLRKTEKLDVAKFVFRKQLGRFSRFISR
ncbi:MAG: glycosyltransferase family 2 protein [Thaumarchaeota archaeon]|nr:glycosyltransferase family 2 protein [Nitrososphaerota archaeon]